MQRLILEQVDQRYNVQTSMFDKVCLHSANLGIDSLARNMFKFGEYSQTLGYESSKNAMFLYQWE